MLRILFITIFLIGMPLLSVAQSDADAKLYEKLKKEYTALKSNEDSLSRSLSDNRKLFEEGTKEQRKEATEAIVRLESEIFDLRSAISKVANRISAIEQQYAEQSLRAGENLAEKRGFFNNDIFTRNLTAKDRMRLSSSGKIESDLAAKSSIIENLYARLSSIKEAYDKTLSQRELDSLLTEGEKIKNQIISADRTTGNAWKGLYNFKVDTYTALFDKIEDLDRTVRENIETYSRDARRAEALFEGSLASNIAAFTAQRGLTHAYEKAIAASQNLRLAADSVARVKPITIPKEGFADIVFAPRVLTLYAPITFIKGSMPIERVDQIPSVIIPESGVYYSIQIALMSTPTKSLEMFKGAWPLQVEKTADGKYRYMAGGFNTYAQAISAVGQLQKAGFKYPVMMAWIDGKLTTSTKAKAYEATMPTKDVAVGSFKIEITSSSDNSVAETLRSLVEMHAKGKAIARSGSGKDLVYTIAEFADKYEAQALAHIIGERINANVEVVEIK